MSSTLPSDLDTATKPSHDERLFVPVMWWVVSMFLALTFVVAVWAVLSDLWALGALVIFTSLVAGFLMVYGSARISAEGAGLRAGGAKIGWEWVSGATALDSEQSRTALNAAADGRTWLLVRPFLKGCVQVDLDDPADPHRHWLLGSRHPSQLAAAINARSTPKTTRPGAGDTGAGNTGAGDTGAGNG